MKLKRFIIILLLAGITAVLTLPQTACRPNKPVTETPADTTVVDTVKKDTAVAPAPETEVK